MSSICTHRFLSLVRSFSMHASIALVLVACSGKLEDAALLTQNQTEAPDPSIQPDDTKLDGEFFQLAQDETHVYAARRNGSILRIQKSGGLVEVVEPGNPVNGAFSGGLAVDATHVYWTTLGGSTSGRVLREPKNGGPVEVLADDQKRPRGLAISDTTVFWGTEGDDAIAGGNARAGSLYAVPKTGGRPTLLVDESPIEAVAVSGDYVYFVRGPWSPRIGAVGRVAVAGGVVEWLAQNRWAFDLHVAGDTVAWTERANIGFKLTTLSLTSRTIVERAEGEIGAAAIADEEILFTDEDRPDALLRSLSVVGGGPKILRRTHYAADANVFTGPIVADKTRVFWLESWWSYSAAGPHTILRSKTR